jgi:hypothetical protein
VASLTSEKASLEKENNLLKFIVVNGNGGNPGVSQAQLRGGNGMTLPGGGMEDAIQMGKRKRD